MPRLWEATKSKLLLIHLRDSFKRSRRKSTRASGQKGDLTASNFSILSNLFTIFTTTGAF